MARETGLWDWLRGVLPIGQYSRIESGDTAPGFPDVYAQILNPYSDDPLHYTFELKFARRPKARIPFKNLDDGLHQSQRIWIRENHRNGGTNYVIAQVGTTVFIIPGEIAINNFNGATREELTEMSEAILDTGSGESAAAILGELLL